MKIVFFILTKLPLKLTRILGKFVGYLLYFFSKDKHIITQNINLCFPKLAPAEQKTLIKKSTIELGISIIESFFFWGNSFKDNNKYVTKIEGKELLRNNKPTILLTPHFGAFELTGRVLSLQQKLTFLYKPAKNKTLDKLIFHSRNKGNLTVVPTNNKGIMAITKALKQNEIVGILPDQSPGKVGGVVVDFFGNGSKTTSLLSKLSNKFSTDVVLTYALRTKDGYEIYLKKVDIHDANVHKSIKKMNKIIEELILKYPQQYLWSYKKFKATHSYK